jgi:FMN phosphatase YigB (HAD superfamily)
VEYATGARAVAVAKPHRFIFDLARDRLPAARRIAMVGDNLDADPDGRPGRGCGRDRPDRDPAIENTPPRRTHHDG